MKFMDFVYLSLLVEKIITDFENLEVLRIRSILSCFKQLILRVICEFSQNQACASHRFDCVLFFRKKIQIFKSSILEMSHKKIY
ncbi:hypothetical protein HZS_3909 [Henneguya salminicola]|nr:hypothetical protein HZS_3909 [Henneguya salminicola]